MADTLKVIAKKLEKANKKVQLIYAFNGSGKTRLSREFKKLIAPKNRNTEEEGKIKIMYYNAFTEDLFYWDNDLENNEEPKLKIQNNDFTNWILKNQGKGNVIIQNFQHYVNNDKLTPDFNLEKNEVTTKKPRR